MYPALALLLLLPARSLSLRIFRDLRVAIAGLSSPTLLHLPPLKRAETQCRLGPDSRPPGGDGTTPSVSSTSRHPSQTSTPAAAPSATSAPYQLVQSYSGTDFFTQWDFNTGSDPTHGAVDYLTQGDAQSAGLAYVNSAGNFVMKVDTTPKVSNLRKSVRITTQASFNGGLVLMDSVHMPTGCGTWPAFWSNGPDWPQNGEIDIVEGVSNYTDASSAVVPVPADRQSLSMQNQATVHTRHGCTLPSSFNTPSSFAQVASGQLVGGTNCAADETGNQGCGVRILDPSSFGPGFNSNGGGVYAMLWDDTGIAIYFFTRNQIPADVSAGHPTPSTWGLPSAKWPATTCNPFTYFQDHVAIFDTTLCGDWAGSVWSSSGLPGQEQSCAQRTGNSDCVSFVLNNGQSFQEAYWEVSYVKLFQLK